MILWELEVRSAAEAEFDAPYGQRGGRHFVESGITAAVASPTCPTAFASARYRGA